MNTNMLLRIIREELRHVINENSSKLNIPLFTKMLQARISDPEAEGPHDKIKAYLNKLANGAGGMFSETFDPTENTVKDGIELAQDLLDDLDESKIVEFTDPHAEDDDVSIDDKKPVLDKSMNKLYLALLANQRQFKILFNQYKNGAIEKDEYINIYNRIKARRIKLEASWNKVVND